MYGELIFRTIIPGIVLGTLLGYIINRRPEYIEMWDPRNWELDFNPKKVMVVGAACMVVVIALFVSEVFISRGIEQAGHKTLEEQNYATNMADFSVLFFFVAITVIPIFEEWIFRGVFLEEIHRRIGGKIGKWVAVVATAIGFGIAHLLNPGVLVFGFIPFTAAGVVYGIVYVYAGLKAAIFTHIGSNLFPFILVGVLALLGG